MDEWHLFQNFVLGLLQHDGYKDVRLSNVRSDFGRDAVAITPDGKKCFVAVSFDCSLSKIRYDAERWTQDPNREDAAVMLFATNESPTNKTVSKWKAEITRDFGLELRLFNNETILSTATSLGIWRETCARLGIPGYRQGYVKVSPYDGELVRRALKARPPEWLRQRVPLRQWEELSGELRSRLIFGKPGSGKTTTIFEQLERAKPETVLVVELDVCEASQIDGLLDEAAGGAVIVIDDLHEDHKRFVNLGTALRTRKRDAPKIAEQYKAVVLLAATRSQEWEAIRGEIPISMLQDLGLLGEAELTLTGLDVDQCRRLIEICRDEWKLIVEPRLLKQAARAAAERDATPLYVISMLAPARGRDDRTLRDEHLAGLPANVRDLWKRYWTALDPTAQGVLRLVRLFWAANVPPQRHLLLEAAKSFGISPADVSASLDRLERALWLARTAGVPACLDVQLEVIELDGGWYELWDQFIFASGAGVETRAQLHNGTGAYYYQWVAPRTKVRAEYGRRLADTARHFEAVGDLGRERDEKDTVAMALNNASSCYSALAGLETTREGRRSWLTKAVAAVEEAVGIYRELGVAGDLAMSLSNASNLYSALAGLETTRESRRSWLTRAVAAVEESIAIRRELGVAGDLAMSLSNASNLYSALAGLETTREGRRSWLTRAVAAVEEAVRIYRELGVAGDLAMSLGSLCHRQRSLADAELEPAEVARRLTLSREAIDEAVPLFREAGNTPYLLMSLQDAVMARRMQAGAGVGLDVGELMELVEEGLGLAKSMEDEEKIDFFTEWKHRLTEGEGAD